MHGGVGQRDEPLWHTAQACAGLATWPHSGKSQFTLGCGTVGGVSRSPENGLRRRNVT